MSYVLKHWLILTGRGTQLAQLDMVCRLGKNSLYCAVKRFSIKRFNHVLWIAQNVGGSSAVYQEVGSSRFELEHTNTGTYNCFFLQYNIV